MAAPVSCCRRLTGAGHHGSNALQAKYVFGPDVDEPIVSYDSSGNRTFLHADERGSIVALSNSSGAAVAINVYDEYGMPKSDSSGNSLNSGRFQYTGQLYLSEIGMYYYKARMYSPTLGRFMQTDPIGYGDGPNWYAYTHNDPVNGRDPTGDYVQNFDPTLGSSGQSLCPTAAWVIVTDTIPDSPDSPSLETAALGICPMLAAALAQSFRQLIIRTQYKAAPR